MTDPYVSNDGTVYTTHHAMHPDPRDCPHQWFHACKECDHGGYFAQTYPDACPWAQGVKS